MLLSLLALIALTTCKDLFILLTPRTPHQRGPGVPSSLRSPRPHARPGARQALKSQWPSSRIRSVHLS